MRKVLFVINTLGTAGAEKALLEMLNRLDTPDTEVSIFVLLNQGELAENLPKHVNLLNKKYNSCSVHDVAGKKRIKRTVIRYFFSHFSGAKNGLDIIKNYCKMRKSGNIRYDKLLWNLIADGAPRITEEYDTAVAFLEGGSTYYVSKYVKAKKKIAFVHIDYCAAGYRAVFDKKAYDNMDAIYAISHEVRYSFLRVHPECSVKTEVFHNLLNIDEIRKKALEQGGFDDDYDGIRILSIGRLTLQKSFDFSIDAMKILKDRGVRARWYVLGEGNQRDFLHNRIVMLGLHEDFFLLGTKSNPYPYLRQSDIYVHASKYEGKSIAVQEARILGCPIIVTDYAGNSEQVHDGADGMVCSFTAESLADTIQNMLADREAAKRMGEAASKRIEEEQRNESQKEIIDILFCGD